MKSILHLSLFFVFLFVFSSESISQTREDLQKIVNKTNVGNLRQSADKHFKENKAKREFALQLARKNGWLIRGEVNGNLMELQCLDKYGYPKYYVTNNANAAKTTSTNFLYNGGGLGLSLDGTNMKIGLWDGANVRVTHQEFNNTGSVRVTNIDNVTSDSHATHVAGTLIAGGVRPDAKGMAFKASIDSYNWTDDVAEMTNAASNGMLLTNNSYGYACGWFWDGVDWYWYGNTSVSTSEDYNFGFYDGYAADFDYLAFNAPYFLMVKAVGNDAFIAPASQPVTHKVWNGLGWISSTAVRDINGGTDGYDCINSWGNAKNVLTVGAVDDIPGGYTQPSDVSILSYSSRGPTDDGRIKPDLVANGVNLYSTDVSNNSNVYYSNKSGTSMSAPNVSGSLLLLQQYYKELNNSYMKAATLKALAIHTADECGSAEGPDYNFGWGLLNAASAANVITNKDVSSIILEESLLNGASYSFDVTTTGTSPLVVTIAWTDPKGPEITAQLNNPIKMLVNDLDLKLQKDASTYYPYVLDRTAPANPATKANNNTDNVEKVYIANPVAGTYTVVVDHKGTITDGPQSFSLIVTGISLGFAEVTTNSVSNIAKKSADVAGEVLSDNGNTVTERGFVYNSTGNPKITDNKVIAGSGTGSFSTTLTGLNPTTTYYVKAYATNSAGTVYGAQIEFTTICEVITVFPFQETFDNTTSCPDCWQITDSLNNGKVWRFGSFIPEGTNLPFQVSGTYAYFNSEGYSTGNQNSDLISPTFDFSGYNSVTLSFQHYFKSYAGSVDSLFYSINNGTTWTYIWRWTATSSNPITYNKTFTSGLVNQPQVKFRWNYKYTGSSKGYYWCIKNITVSAVAAASLVVTNTQTLNSNMAYLDVNIKNSGKLTLASDKILTVTRNFTIESDIDGTGSFIQNGPLYVGENIKVQKYLPNSTISGWTLSVPVKNADETVFPEADGIYSYNSSLRQWDLHTSGALQQMTGYVVRFPVTKTIEFTDTLNNGDFSRTNLVRTTSPSNYGWNYVGNPYPSPISWDANPGISRIYVNNAVYHRMTNGNIAAYVGGMGTGTNECTDIIPSMQAFWVQVTAGQSNGALYFTNDARVDGANNSYKESPADILRLNIENNGESDEAVVLFKESASTNFDSEFDALKLYAENDELAQLFSMVNNDEYAINTMPPLTASVTIPLGFKTQNEGKFSITASELNSFKNDVNITLEDLYENKLIDLKHHNKYTFITPATLSTDRFVLHFNPASTDISQNNITESKNINIYAYHDAVYVSNVNDNNATAFIYNVMGQEVMSQKLVPNSLNKLAANVVSGQYMVKVVSNSKEIMQKVYINKF